jgi:hypothetical protein
MTQLIAEGCETGDFRPCDPQQTLTSILGVVVFYFISIPAQQLMAAGDPFSPERLAARRAAVLDFISAAVFSDSAAKGNAKPVLATGLNRDNNSLRRKGKSK